MLPYLNAAAVIGALLYWHIREWQQKDRVRQSASKHQSPLTRFFIRAIMPVVAVLMVFQLIAASPSNTALSPDIAFVLESAGQVIFIAGIILGVWSREVIGKNWAHAADYQIIPGQDLVTHGPYRYIRHPIYTAFLMIFLGIELVQTSWLIVLIVPLALFLRWQARWEEKLLAETFHQRWRAYAQKTGMFLPVFTVLRE